MNGKKPKPIIYCYIPIITIVERWPDGSYAAYLEAIPSIEGKGNTSKEALDDLCEVVLCALPKAGGLEK